MSEEMKRCPFCGEEILAIAKKCKHCGSNLEEASATEPLVSKPAADYGMFLLAIPVIATVLIWFWVSSMNLLQSPGSTMDLIMIATILGTAIVAAMEASKVGMKSDKNKGTYSPTAWFFIITFLWIVGYPAYLLKRKHSGLTNRLVAGILIALVFVGSFGIMYSVIEDKKAEIRGGLKQMEQQLESMGVPEQGEHILGGSEQGVTLQPASVETQPLEGSTQSSREGATVEQSGICKGLDLVVTAEQLECLNRKFALADKKLNESYKQLMGTLDDSRKYALKKEQVIWIKEKEEKCARAGKEMEGGSMEAVLISDCEVQMTEQRLTSLTNYK